MELPSSFENCIQMLRDNDETLTVLKLHFCVTNDRCKALAEALEKNTNLRELYIGYGSTEDSGVKALAHTLTINRTIIKVDLSYTAVASYGAGYLAEALKVNKTLKELNLAGTGIRTEGINKLLKSLNRNFTLEYLTVPHYLSYYRNTVQDEINRFLDRNRRYEVRKNNFINWLHCFNNQDIFLPYELRSIIFDHLMNILYFINFNKIDYYI